LFVWNWISNEFECICRFWYVTKAHQIRGEFISRWLDDLKANIFLIKPGHNKTVILLWVTSSTAYLLASKPLTGRLKISSVREADSYCVSFEIMCALGLGVFGGSPSAFASKQNGKAV
jgi:hypothetical protein